MRYLSITLAGLLLGAGLVGAAVIVMRTANPDMLVRASLITTRPNEYEYQRTDGSKLKDFNLSFELTLAESNDSARVLVDLQPADESSRDVSEPYDNAYYIDLSSKIAEIGSFESGLARPLRQGCPVELSVGEVHHILIKRRTPWLSLIIDGRIVAEVQDETHAFGGVAFGLHGSESRIETVKVQPIASIYFTDNFMQDEAEKSHWTALRGDWSVKVIDNPAMSVDAFHYRAVSAETASAVTGEVFWDNYRFTAAARSVDGESIGLLLYYRSERDYYLFTWDRRDDAEPTLARKRLIKMHDGKRTVLAEAVGGFIPNQWYTLGIEANSDTLRATIDGHPVLSARDEHLIGGMVGLYAARTDQTRFDDVHVHTATSYTDDMKEFPAGRWQVLGGRWEAAGAMEARTGSLVVETEGTTHARGVTGSSRWRNYVVSTRIEPGDAARCGINLCYLDENTHYSVICNRSEKGDLWQLISRHNNVENLLAQAATDRHQPRYNLSASTNRGRLAVAVDGVTIMETFDRTLPTGAVGLWTEPAPSDQSEGAGTTDPVVMTRFTGLSVDFVRKSIPLLTKNPIFEHEQTMGQWSGLVTDWNEPSTDGTDRKLNWHRGFFPGACTLEVKMSEFDKPDSTTTIVLNGDGNVVESGYRLEVGPTKIDSDTVGRIIQLFRGDRLVADVNRGAIQPVSLKLERTGGLLVGYVDGRPMLNWHDPEPLGGNRMGWHAENVRVNPDDVLVSSPNVYQYAFTRAPTEWRSFGGIWEISSRWECDRRWSFFSGRSRKDEVIALWSKRLFKGDVTVEFYVGPKMNRSRGKSYEYVRDFNCTIAADGYDLSSGYSFIVGGFKNTKSCIYRKTKMVGKPSSTVIKTSGLHRRWLHVRVQKKDGKVALWLDGKLLAEYNDPNPLEGSRIAFWTKDCGFMLAKITISCENGTEFEDPDFYLPRRCRSIYGPIVSARSK